MLKTFAIASLAIAMSVGLAEAKGAKTVATCQTEVQATAICACGPAKAMCKKGQWCHAFANACGS